MTAPVKTIKGNAVFTIRFHIMTYLPPGLVRSPMPIAAASAMALPCRGSSVQPELNERGNQQIFRLWISVSEQVKLSRFARHRRQPVKFMTDLRHHCDSFRCRLAAIRRVSSKPRSILRNILISADDMFYLNRARLVFQHPDIEGPHRPGRCRRSP